MSPTGELRWLTRTMQGPSLSWSETVLQQKWVQHHIPAGKTEAPFEWRDVPIVEEE